MWLSQTPDKWPKQSACHTEVEKRREKKICVLATIDDRILDAMNNQSSLFKLKKKRLLIACVLFTTFGIKIKEQDQSQCKKCEAL